MRSVIIVGGGIWGVCVAHHLAGAGWQVTLIEQATPGHDRQSSAGRTRLLRSAHGDDSWYAELAWRARSLWRELGDDLFVETGMCWFAHSPDGWEAASARVLESLDIPIEYLDVTAAARLFPSFSGDDLLFVLREPHAGVLRARQAVEVMGRRAVARGVTLQRAKAEPYGDAVLVNGHEMRADQVVWACGPWLPSLFPGLVDVKVTKQDTIHFAAAGDMPAWVDVDASVYGHRDLGWGMKLTSDLNGPPDDPDAERRQVDHTSVESARAYLGRRFPGLADAPLALTEVCQYTSTPDANWIIAEERPGVWLLGGDSGHGFKHGPALAEYVASLLDGAAPDPRFALGPRKEGPILRTRQT